ncbi:hypothetical protein F5051DRAFT_287886, partial [Lentinula edodes]
VADSFSEAFTSNIVAWTGDPGTPMLFNLAIADFRLSEHPGDVVLHDKVVNHTEQADDVLMTTMCPTSFQSKLNQFGEYSAQTGFIVSVPKCVYAVY